jgi:Na+-translocating ferredoxin:NAD+ oxidoreductase RnfE subunit
VHKAAVRYQTTYILLLELGPVLLVVDHEASSGLGVTHLECVVLVCCRVKVVSEWRRRWKEVQVKPNIEIKS